MLNQMVCFVGLVVGGYAPCSHAHGKMELKIEGGGGSESPSLVS